MSSSVLGPLTSFSAEKPRIHRSTSVNLHMPSPFFIFYLPVAVFYSSSVYRQIKIITDHLSLSSLEGYGKGTLWFHVSLQFHRGLFLLLHTWIRSQHVLASKGEIFFEVILVIFCPSVGSLSLSIFAICSLHFILVSYNLSIIEYICESSFMLWYLILVGVGYKN